eukprot:1438550-Pyramimonas_sp.AAC.1
MPTVNDRWAPPLLRMAEGWWGGGLETSAPSTRRGREREGPPPARQARGEGRADVRAFALRGLDDLQ